MMWLTGPSGQPRRVDDWALLLKLHQRRGFGSQIVVIGVSTEVVADSAGVAGVQGLFQGMLLSSTSSQIARLALVELWEGECLPMSVTILGDSHAWGVLLAPTHPGQPLVHLERQLSEVKYVVQEALFRALRLPGPTFDGVVRAIKSEFAMIAARKADEATQETWDQVTSLTSNVAGNATTVSSEKVTSVFDGLRGLQRNLRDAAGEYQAVGDTEGANIFRDRLAELGVATQALGVSVSIMDARGERIVAEEQERRTSRITTMALVVAFPAIYLTALQFVVAIDATTVCQRLELVVLGSIASALIGWGFALLASHRIAKKEENGG